MLTALVVLALGVGIGAAMTSVTVFRGMSGNPIPWKEGQLYNIQLDHWKAGSPFVQPGEPARQLTYRDAVALWNAGQARYQAMMFPTEFVVTRDGFQGGPLLSPARLTTADFFPMFDTPFRFGHGWDVAADRSSARVAVLSRSLNERLFDGRDSLGQSVTLRGERFKIVGVLDEWHPTPLFYDVITGPFRAPEDIYVPFAFGIEQKVRSSGNNDCWPSFSGDYDAFLRSDCVWINFWIEVASPAEAEAYHRFLDTYALDQKKLGRFPQPVNNRVRTVSEWMSNQGVVQGNTRTQLLLSFAFLLVCLINSVSLLLSRAMAGAKEISIRRALGASRRHILVQCLLETGLVGTLGAVAGIVLTWAGCQWMLHLDPTLVGVARFDWVMASATTALAVVCALAAGAFPAWRVSRLAPAVFLKAE